MNARKTVVIFFIFSTVNLEGFQFQRSTISAIDTKKKPNLKEVLNLPPPFNPSTPVKYETHQELMDRFEIYAVKFPRLAETNSIGRSVDGRELKYLKLTQDADKERKLLKPMVKFIANIHGDETVGRQMLQYLAQDLIHNYNSGDPFAEFLLNNTEIYLLPDMNPDGFHKSSPGPRPSFTNNYTCPHSTPGRVNSNGKDLNRDFPHTWTFRKSWDGKWNSISSGRQPETLAVMNWTFSNPFVLSANFHSGALVASYAYDTLKPSRKREQRRGLAEETPDQDLFKKLATIYSENNIDMYNQRHENSNEWHRLHKCSKGYGGPFENGITNGAAWYNLEGGMQDFNYAYTNCMEITLELSCCKYPPPELLKDYWIHNRNSLLYYTEAAHLGVKGLVQDSLGNPIYNAKITVRNNKKTVTSSKRGEYWRLLLPGNYTLTASADGYESQTASVHIPQKNVNTWETPAQRHDFELTKKKVNNNRKQNNNTNRPLDMPGQGGGSSNNINRPLVMPGQDGGSNKNSSEPVPFSYSPESDQTPEPMENKDMKKKKLKNNEQLNNNRPLLMPGEGGGSNKNNNRKFVPFSFSPESDQTLRPVENKDIKKNQRRKNKENNDNKSRTIQNIRRQCCKNGRKICPQRKKLQCARRNTNRTSRG